MKVRVRKKKPVLHLVDWWLRKTGKYREPKWQGYDQLLFYSIYFFKKYPKIDKIVLSYVYIEHEDHENDLTLERKYLRNYISQLMEWINNVETDKEFVKTPSGLCKYCKFKTHCSTDE